MLSSLLEYSPERVSPPGGFIHTNTLVTPGGGGGGVRMPLGGAGQQTCRRCLSGNGTYSESVQSLRATKSLQGGVVDYIWTLHNKATGEYAWTTQCPTQNAETHSLNDWPGYIARCVVDANWLHVPRTRAPYCHCHTTTVVLLHLHYKVHIG